MVCRNESIWCLTKFVGNLFLFRKNVTAVCVWVLLIFISRLEKGDHCSKEENWKKTNNYKRKKDRSSERKWWGDNKHWKKEKKIYYTSYVWHARRTRTHTYIDTRACGRAYRYRHVITLHTRALKHTHAHARARARVCVCTL